MIEYLEGRPLDLPAATVAPGAAPAGALPAGHGTVTTTLAAGELLLEDEAGGAFRVEAPGPRLLPAGTYRLRTYRAVREDAGERWHVSATAPAIRTVEVRAGETTRVELDPTVRLVTRLRARQAGMEIRGDGGAGLTIYRAGRRIPMGFRLLSADGATLAEGSMRYG